MVMPTWPTTASTLHSSAAARKTSRRPQPPRTAHPDPAKRLEQWRRGGGGSPDVEWLDVVTDEDLATPPPGPPWSAPTWALPPEGADPTVYVPDYEHYDDAPRGSLPPVDNLPDSWGPVTPMNLNKYGTTVVTLTTRLLFAFGWLVVDAEWVMGIVRGAHGHEWGEFFRRSGAMTGGATERLMAAYLTWWAYPNPAASNHWLGAPNSRTSHRRGRARTAMRQWPG